METERNSHFSANPPTFRYPWGFTRFGLADARNAGTEWDWFKNREGLLNFWRGGVLKNRDVDAIWPVGLPGTRDRSYTFPDGMSEDEKNKSYREAIEAQVAMTKSLLPADKTSLFHFTLYTEMLPPSLLRAHQSVPDRAKHRLHHRRNPRQ